MKITLASRLRDTWETEILMEMCSFEPMWMFLVNVRGHANVAIREMHHYGSLEPSYSKVELTASAAPTTSRNGDATSENGSAKPRRSLNIRRRRVH
uniref:Secreted protein n=1 Tax=Parascaris univalens TaxID=6257 RepID=A0A915CFQ5_PARUN